MKWNLIVALFMRRTKHSEVITVMQGISLFQFLHQVWLLEARFAPILPTGRINCYGKSLALLVVWPHHVAQVLFSHHCPPTPAPGSLFFFCPVFCGSDCPYNLSYGQPSNFSWHPCSKISNLSFVGKFYFVGQFPPSIWTFQTFAI